MNYVTLVAFNGSPVRVANQRGAVFPTTGTGALVFADGATLTNVTITGIVNPSPFGFDAGTVAAPSAYWVTPDRGIYSPGTNILSVAANGANILTMTPNGDTFYFAGTGTAIGLFSDAALQSSIQGTDTAGSTMVDLHLQKYGANVIINSSAAVVAGGDTTRGSLKFGSDSIYFGTGTGAPDKSAPYGSLYMRHDSTALPYFNDSGSTTWQQLVGRTATQTLTGKSMSGSANTFTLIPVTALNSGTGANNTTFWRGDGTWASTSATGVEVGVSTIASGTSGRVLYDNAGVLGEMTNTGTGTVNVLQNTPTLTTPVLGVATGTSLALGVVLISTYDLRTAGTVRFDGALTYGGVTLTNAVTGTGSMVLSAAPTLTGTTTVATLSATAATIGTLTVGTIATGPGTLSNLVQRVQSFAASGTYTPHANMVSAVLFCLGAGGAGGSTANATANLLSYGAGGGAGSWSQTVVTRAAVLPNQTVTIGAAGAAAGAGANAGGNGGDTSIGALCIGKGGTGGGAGNNTAAIGSLGGIAGTGDITTTGDPGTSVFPGGDTNDRSVGGAGGSSIMGGGGRSATGQGAGSAASGKGGGGGGGGSFNAGGATAGGAGTIGYAYVIEYCTA